MKPIQFEAVKYAMNQTKDGHRLTLTIHPDDVPEEIFRDYVGARYQFVAVRLDDQNQPLDRQKAFAGERSMRIASMLVKDPKFWEWLKSINQIDHEDVNEASEWMKIKLQISSKKELPYKPEAQQILDKIYREYEAWKN